MNSENLKKLLTTAGLAAATICAAARDAEAFPVAGVYVEDPRCDILPNQTFGHELGQVGFFPQNEAITVNVSPATFTVCVPDDNIANDWIVDIKNVSGVAWTDLFFVADLGMTIGNADGSVFDAANAPNVLTDAFKIDSVGINPNLLGESILADGIFAPGESWRFNVSNFGSLPGAPPFPPIIQTPGKFAGSDPIVFPPNNTASILANPVPEPTAISLALLGAGALLLRRPRRA